MTPGKPSSRPREVMHFTVQGLRIPRPGWKRFLETHLPAKSRFSRPFVRISQAFRMALLQDGVLVRSGSFLAQPGKKPGHGERAGVRPANRLAGQTPTRQTMKKSLTTFIILSALALSGCAVGVSPVQPPHAGHYGHPSVVVIPGTYVYAMTEVADDIYFHVGWWWRLWDGRWYTSRYYDRGWSHYRGVPVFYRDIDPRWRDFYRHRRWHGHPWDCERIPAPRLQHDWKRWQDNRHWEREKNWGVRGFKPAPYRQTGLKEAGRNDPRYRHADRHQGSRYENRQHESRSMSAGRQEFSRERAGTRPVQPVFKPGVADGRDQEIRSRTQGRKTQDSRHTQPGVERRRGNDDTDGNRRDRLKRDRQEYDRPPYDQARQESGEKSRQRRGQFQAPRQGREQPPMSGEEQRGASMERAQKREGSLSRRPMFQSRQSEGRQDKPRRQERQHDENQRRRPTSESPWQSPAQPGGIPTR